MLKTTSKSNTALIILLSRQVVSAMSTDAEVLGNEKYELLYTYIYLDYFLSYKI